MYMYDVQLVILAVKIFGELLLVAAWKLVLKYLLTS